jgi:hypothetical protein
MALANGWTDLAARIQADYAAGVPTRTNVAGTEGVAFSWSAGMPQSVANYISTMQIAGRSVPIGSVTPSGTPVGIVAAGQPKNDAVSVAVAPLTLAKHAGMGPATLEDTMDAQGLIPAIGSVLAAGAVLSFEAAAMTAILSATNLTSTGTTWHDSILEAQGKVIANGGSPGLLIVSAVDYAAVVSDLAAAPGFSLDPRSPVGQYFGAAVHVSPKLATGAAIVCDPAAFVAVESIAGPMVLVDPFSQASSNKVQIVVDLFAAVGTVNAALSVECTKAP